MQRFVIILLKLLAIRVGLFLAWHENARSKSNNVLIRIFLDNDEIVSIGFWDGTRTKKPVPQPAWQERCAAHEARKKSIKGKHTAYRSQVIISFPAKERE